ncbi:ParB/RepB/Spo0J family partition protein [Pseudonocardia sp. TRM90224]|uniref:ParB/RepB/Spo0J family partition protein n=1 Tax=Pseudonocardia sp. TRM90224 TaxID=2812678 RepID=UPI001E3321C7|nr:ParB/RepB/Spo0J family partition protein [Pseudonocardia sp. TRM90224]
MSQPAAAVVDLGALLPGHSPRLAGEDMTHVRLLAEAGSDLPPILVHRETMRVIDGMHRLRATAIRGGTTIAVRYFEGTEDEAFVLAVETNLAHGLPLSLADREAAAVRIIAAHPNWSDRAVAARTGLAGSTVATVRRRGAGGAPIVTARVGRDGRMRPVNGAEGRRRASAVITANPDASLRQIARSAGVSIGTARDVRERMGRGEDPLPMRLRRTSAARSAPTAAAASFDVVSLLRTLQRDPSLRFNETGRGLVKWLLGHAVVPADNSRIVDAVPPHCTKAVADLALACAAAWQQLAESLRERDALRR